MRNRFVMALIAAASIGVIGQAQQQARKKAATSTRIGRRAGAHVDARIKDDAAGRREAVKEQFGGEFTPEFMESLMTAANQQAATVRPGGPRRHQGRTAGGEWTNVGPYRSNWIQNGVRFTESDTGRVRNFLFIRTTPTSSMC